MNIVPRPRAPFHTPTPPFAGRRWASRVYPGALAQAAWVREDLRADLYRIKGLCPDLGRSPRVVDISDTEKHEEESTPWP